MKRALYLILMTLLAVYLMATLFLFMHKKGRSPRYCTKVEIEISDSEEKHFVRDKELISYLKRKKLYPLKKKAQEINTDDIEQILLEHRLIETAEVAQTLSGGIKIVISQKMPILRIFSSEGSYYVDKSGDVMPLISEQAIYVPVASGNIKKTFAMTGLYEFALFLQGHDFWNNQIAQIYVRTEKDIELIPRIGSHNIILGSLDDYEKKLEHLRLFYDQVIPKMGWGKYSVINLKYKNQIVCKKSKNTKL